MRKAFHLPLLAALPAVLAPLENRTLENDSAEVLVEHYRHLERELLQTWRTRSV